MSKDVIQIQDLSFWGAVGFVGGVVGWLVRLERRLNSRMTRQEHERICERSNSAINKKLDAIADKLERQSEQTLEHRQWVGDSLATIRTHVAVIRDRMGDDQLKDTGTFPRGVRE